MTWNYVFDRCVDVLYILARLTGTTYKEINVIIFCIIEPLIFIFLIFIIFRLHKRNKKLVSIAQW